MMMDSPDALSAALRAVSFVLLLNAAGIPIFIAAFGHLMPNSLPDVKRLGGKFAIAALVFVAAHQAFEAARMAGEMSGIADPAMHKMALLSPTGATFATRILGVILVAIGLHLAPSRAGTNSATGSMIASAAASGGAPQMLATSRAVATPLPTFTHANAVALFGTLLIAASFTLMGHTTTTPHRLAAVALILLHLLVAAFWLGSLWPLYLTARKDSPAAAARTIERFSAVAAWLVPLILLAGIGLTSLLLPSLATFKQPYGQLLLTKLAGFAILMACAALNKWHFGPACAEGDTLAFKRTVIIEYALISAVLSATAIMTTFFSPDAAP